MSKQNKKKNLRSSLLLLLVAALLLVSSSYAWFTANQTVTVSSLNVNVAAQNGLQISTDGTNWKSIIQNEDITSVHATTYPTSINQLPGVLAPVSTAGNVTTGKLDMFYGAIGTNTDGDYTITATPENDTEGTNGNYIAFDLFFKVDKDTPVYITTASNIIPKEGSDPKGLDNSGRFGFVVEGNTSAGSPVATIQALNGGTTETTTLWEPNYDVHTAAAVANAYDNYGITTTETGGAALPYYGIKAAIATEDNVLMQQKTAPATDFFAAVTPSIRTIKDFTANQPLFTLSAGITKVRLYMWVEGQDVDCENNASGTDITFNLQISTLAE